MAALRRRLVSAAAAAALAGCSDPTAPVTAADVTGTYVLVSIDRVVPPIPFGAGTTIVADSVTYSADSTWREVEVSGVEGGGLTPTDVARFSGTWWLDGSRRVLYRREGLAPTLPPTPHTVRDRGRVLEISPRAGSLWRYVGVP